jgi:methyltransferase
MTNWPLVWVLGLIIASRLVEMAIAARNTRRLVAGGWREVGARHFPLFIALHVSLLGAVALTTPADRQPSWPLLGVLVILQVARAWTIASLGPLWTTRVITHDAEPLTAKGPYRFLRHPAYLIVSVEIAVLPLAFANWPVAVIWSLLNLLLLLHRSRLEDAALAIRRTQGRAPRRGVADSAAPLRR